MKNMSKTKKTWLIIIGGIYLVLFYAFMYSDILITTSHGINFWDALFQGDIFQYYAVCKSDVSNAAYEISNVAAYDFLIYVVFAIWNFPLWAVRKLFAVDIWNSVLALMWAKSIILLFLFLTIRAMKKVCDTVCMQQDEMKQVILLFMTSSIAFASTFVMSQYDIIYLYLMVEAFNYYLKKDMKKFVLFMAIALPIKPLSIFLFAPLVLYKEKNVIRIGCYVLALMCPWLIMKLLFAGIDSAYMTNVGVMFRNKISVAGLEMPIFFFAVFIFYIFCYAWKEENDNSKFQLNAVRIVFMAYALLFLLCGGNPYWFILMLPFQYLLIGMKQTSALVSTIIETITSLCVIGSYVWQIPWCFDTRILRSTYVARLFGNREDFTNNITEVIHHYMPALYDMAVERVPGYLFGMFVAGTLVFIYINYGKSKESALQDRGIPGYLFVVRFLCCVAIAILPMIAYIL